MTHSPFVVLNFSHPVLDERWINLMNLIVTNHLNHQDNGRFKLHQFNSNFTPLLQRPVPWYQTVDNCDVEVEPWYYPLEYTSESVPDPYNNTIKSIGNDEMNQLLELFYSDHDYDLLYVDLQIILGWLVVDTYLLLLLLLYQLCCFTNKEKPMLELQSLCQIFPCLYQPKPTWNWLIPTQDIPKELWLFYAGLQTGPSYISFVNSLLW